MKYVILIFLAVFVLIAGALFAVDFCFFLRDRYCRFHIGRWKDRKVWEKAVYRVNKAWVRHTPTVKITDNSRYMLLDMLKGVYRSRSIQSWQNASVILGLWEYGDVLSARKGTGSLLDDNGQWKKPPVTVDVSKLAYAILKTASDPERVKPAMDGMIELILRHTDDEGLITYTGGKLDPERYVDTLGLVCPFLALYAKVYQDDRYAALAVRQLQFYHDYGLHAPSGLVNHAVNKETKLPLGVYGWGRGTAWYVLGLIDTYYELTQAQAPAILELIQQAAENYRIYQKADGGFGSTLQRPGTYDSSATAALAYFYACCADILRNSAYMDIAQRSLDKLRSVTRITGEIDWCQGDTKGIGIFSQTYDVMPFAQGLALRAISIIERMRTDGKAFPN